MIHDYRYIGQYDRLRQTPEGEDKWQAMMSAAQPVSLGHFIGAVNQDDLAELLDAGSYPSGMGLNEILQEHLSDDPTAGTYMSRWGVNPCYYLQHSGFEFIFARGQC